MDYRTIHPDRLSPPGISLWNALHHVQQQSERLLLVILEEDPHLDWGKSLASWGEHKRELRGICRMLEELPPYEIPPAGSWSNSLLDHNLAATFKSLESPAFNDQDTRAWNLGVEARRQAHYTFGELAGYQPKSTEAQRALRQLETLYAQLPAAYRHLQGDALEIMDEILRAWRLDPTKVSDDDKASFDTQTLVELQDVLPHLYWEAGITEDE